MRDQKANSSPEKIWDIIETSIKRSDKNIEILEPARDIAEEILIKSEISVNTLLGALIYNTGGLLIDSGYLRFLGSGHSRMKRTLLSWNEITNNKLPSSTHILIADDIVGGFFALDLGGFDSVGNIFYMAADFSGWRNTGKKFDEFLIFCIEDTLDCYYAKYRWKNWKRDCEKISGDEGVLFFPPYFIDQSNINKVERVLVPETTVYEANAVALEFEPNTFRSHIPIIPK